MNQSKTIFVDIGGVLLTNGWERQSRQKAVEFFHLDEREVDERHHLTFDIYESGHMTLDEYIHQTIFYCERNFTLQAFKEFMYSQSQPLSPMLEYMREVKKRYNIKITAVSNEGRELSDYRISTYGLKDFIDIFVVSGYVKMRKPDFRIYELALDLSQANPYNVFYIDDRGLFVEIAKSEGINGITHKNVKETSTALEEWLK